MTNKLVLEGTLEWGCTNWEDSYIEVGGERLHKRIGDFLGEADEEYDDPNCQGTFWERYRGVRITVERMRDELAAT